MSFDLDIKSRNTSIFPVVVVGDFGYYSTKEVTLVPTENEDIVTYKFAPLLLSNPSVKESIDLESRKYKISNVNLVLSNIVYNGERVTDRVIPINTTVSIYWISQSVYSLDEAYLAYQGVVRDVSHTEETCNITLEDASQSTFHKKIPINTIPDDDHTIPQRFRGKSYPMVYGWVYPSPCVGVFNHGVGDNGQDIMNSMNYYADYDTSVIARWPRSPLGTKRMYLMRENLLSNDELSWQYGSPGNYFTINNISSLQQTTEEGFSAGTFYEYRKCVKFYCVQDSWSNAGSAFSDFYDIDINMIGSCITPENLYDNDSGNSCEGYSQLSRYSTGSYDMMICFIEWEQPFPPGYAEKQRVFDWGTGPHDHSWMFRYNNNDGYSPGISFNMGPLGGTSNDPEYTDSSGSDHHNSDGDMTWSPAYFEWDDSHGHFSKNWFRFKPHNDHYNEPCEVWYELYEPTLESYFYIEDHHKEDWYCDAEGRLCSEYGAAGHIPAAHVVRDIIEKELLTASNNTVTIDETSYGEANDVNSDMLLDFTVHGKPKDSKKIIEEICSNTRMMPYLKDNKVFFQGIVPKKDPQDSDVKTIRHLDIIDYNISRTKPESVYTEVVVNYKHNLHLDTFEKKTLGNGDPDTAEELFTNFPHGQDESEVDIPYLNSYIGIDEDEQDWKFDSKYIRKDTAAAALQQFLLYWHCNQHSVLKIKVPLSYIKFKIGDYVAFDEMINNVKLFGEDYSLNYYMQGGTVIRNGQQILPTWMITATNKTITHIDLTLIQMHNCTTSSIASVDTEPDLINVDLQVGFVDVAPGLSGIADSTTILLDSSAAENFTVQLDLNGYDPNQSELSYIVYADETLVPTVDNNGVSLGDIVSDIVIDNGISDTGTAPFGEYGIGLGLGVNAPPNSAYGSWLTQWLQDASVPAGSYIEFPSALFSGIAIDNAGQESNSMEFPSFRVYKDNIEGMVQYSYSEGWNLVSLPGNVSSSLYYELFPHAVIGSLYSYGDSYNLEEELDPGKGYWLRMSQSGSMYFYTEIAIESITLEMNEGWNLIGGLANMSTVSNIIDLDNIIVPGTLYGFQGTYVSSSSLEPGEGYWINCSSDGEITIEL